MKKLLCLCVMFVVASPAMAAVGAVTGRVAQVLVTPDDTFGGCMVAMPSADFVAEGLDCRDRWVTFSCTGEFASLPEAKRTFDAAQLAFAMDKRVVLQVDDSRKHNGYCFVQRVTVNK